MTENLGKKLTITVVLAVAAVLCLVVPKRPFRLGLDLQGGTRVVCRFDFDQALKEQKITAQENADRPQLLEEMCTIMRGRIDPNGVYDPTVRPEGSDRIVIEIPGVAELTSTPVQGKLAAAIDASAETLVLGPLELEQLKAFPSGGADIAIGGEKLHYASRVQSTLNGLQRGVDGTSKAAHEAGASIELLTSDDLIIALQNVGDMQFLLGAQAEDVTRLGSDLTRETTKVQDWVKANPGRPIEQYNRLAPSEGGPVTGLFWFPHRIGKDEPETPIEARLRPLVGTGKPEWNFNAEGLSVGYGQDGFGNPAVQFEVATEKKAAFTDFTRTNIGRGMAIVLNGEITTLATIRSALPGGGIIEGGAGGFTAKEVRDLVSVLRSGSLRIKPEIQSKTRIGATLGDEYVKRGFYSGLVSLGLVAVFMLFFYRRLGVFALIGLALNMLLLLGAMAFLQATLTLPGVAGLILTVGMAVDGNILIYERLREELARGMKQVQAARAAFERAAVTIIDSNLTTLIAGVVLYYFGSGPIRGFATTLNIGILSTLFTVIVVTEILMFNDLKRGTADFVMRKVVVNPGWPFSKYTWPALAGSLLAIVAGFGLFLSLPTHEKFGADFTGGFSMTVRTEEPQAIERVRALVAQVPGTIGRSSSVVPILESGDRQSGYRSFRISHKLEGGEVSEAEAVARSESSLREVQRTLAPILQKGPIEVQLAENGTRASGRLHFEEPHPPADVALALASFGLRDAVVEQVAGTKAVYSFSAALDSATSAEGLPLALDNRLRTLRDSQNAFYRYSLSIPESDYIGPQVGSELRDKACLAVLLSLVATLFYVRIRFAEYTYGIAVIVALVHDVLVSLGAVALAIKFQFLQAEIDLAMIASFLTILGYSQNDKIVIFDRVRENRLKSQKPLKQILDDSNNECFGRTVLTGMTTVFALLVMLAFNYGSRNVLEGFSYCLVVGVLTGAYSTIYVASPVLLWLENYAARKSGGEPEALAAGKRKAAAT